MDVVESHVGQCQATALPSNSVLVYFISQNLGQFGHDKPVTREPIAGSPIFCPQVHSNLPFEDALIIRNTPCNSNQYGLLCMNIYHFHYDDILRIDTIVVHHHIHIHIHLSSLSLQFVLAVISPMATHSTYST